MNRYKRIRFDLYIMRQTACLVFNPITVDSFVFSHFLFSFEDRIWDLIVSVPDHSLSFYNALFFNRTAVVQASDSMTASS